MEDVSGRQNSKCKGPEERDQAVHTELKEVWHRKAAVEKGEAGKEGVSQISKGCENPGGLYPKDNGQEVWVQSLYSMALSVAPTSITTTLPHTPNWDLHPSEFKGKPIFAALF